VDAFVALADPVRRAIQRRLAAGPARVVDLAAEHPISRPAISRHLRLLTESGLVHADDRGRERHYRLDPAPLAEVRALLGELDCRPPVGESALDALETEVRRTVRERRRRPAAAPSTRQETA
jgi:DNA-binding transcriptional ArsR family regulator